MAQNNITIQLTIDDKGTLKQVSNKAEKARKGYEGVAKGAAEAHRNTQGAARASSNATKNFSKMSQGLTTGLVPAYATLAANLFAVSAAFNFLKGASDFQRLLEGQEALTMATGIAYRSLAESIQEATDSQITFSEASRSAAIGIAAGLSADQLTDLSAAANTVSRILGRDLVDSYNRLLRGVTKAEPELLDELGIVLRLADASEKYAQKLKINVNELTAFQRTQAVTEDVLRQVEERYGAVNDILDPTGASLNKLAVSFEALSKQLGTALVGPANFIADVLNKNITAATAVMGLFASTIISSVLPSLDELDELTEQSKKFGSQAKSSFDAAADSFSGFSKEVGAKNKIVAGSFGSLTFAIEGTTFAYNALAAAASRAMAVTLRFVSVITKIIGVVGLAITAYSFLKEGLDFVLKKLGLVNEEAERLKETLEELSGGLETATEDFELMAMRMDQIPVKFLADQITILGNAASSIQTSKLEELVGLIRSGTFEGPGLDPKRFISTDADEDSILKAENDLEKYLTAVGKVIPEVSNIISSLEGDFLQLSDSQLASIFSVIDGYKEQLATQNRLKQLSEEQMQAQRALASAYSATPIQRYTRVLEETVEAQRQNIQNLKTQAALNGELTDAQREELALAEKSLAATTASYEAFDNLQKSQIANLEESNALAIEQVNLQQKSTLAAKREAALLSERQAIVALEAKRLEIDGLRAVLQTKLGTDQETAARLAIQNLEREIALDEAKLDLLRSQNDELVQMKNNAIQAFEGTLQTSLRDIITGQTTSIKEAVVNIARATLESVATGLSQMMTRRVSEALFGSKAQDMKQALFDGAERIEDAIVSGARRAAGVLSGDTTQDTSQTPVSREGTRMSVFQRAKSYLSGGPSDAVRVSDTMGSESREVEGIFSRFLGGLKGLFSKDTPFLQSLKDIFAGGLQGFGTLFSDLLGGVLGAGKTGAGLFGTLAKGALSLIPGLGGFAAALPFKDGGISTASGKVQGYAVGGIARGPSQGYPAILHGTEAVVPLPNGKSIPVETRGSMATNNVNINVNVDNQGNAQTDTQMDDQQAGNLGRAISQVVQEELQRQKRPGGILSPFGAA